jgi:hypothetical protein
VPTTPVRRPCEPCGPGPGRGIGQGPLVDADPLGEAVPKLVFGQQSRSAVGVVDDRDLEPRALRRLGLHQVAGVGDVPYDGRGDPAPDIALNQRFTQPDPENLGRVDPAVDARDDVQVQERDEWKRGHVQARVSTGEGPVTVKKRSDVGHEPIVRHRRGDGERQNCRISQGFCLSPTSPMLGGWVAGWLGGWVAGWLGGRRGGASGTRPAAPVGGPVGGGRRSRVARQVQAQVGGAA